MESNDEQRDFVEELDAAMSPYRENCTKIFEKGWNVDNILDYMRDHSPDVIRQREWILLDTGLLEAPDGSLWRELDE